MLEIIIGALLAFIYVNPFSGFIPLSKKEETAMLTLYTFEETKLEEEDAEGLIDEANLNPLSSPTNNNLNSSKQSNKQADFEDIDISKL